MSDIIDPSRLNCGTQTNCTNCLVRYTGEYCEIDVFEDASFFIFIMLNQIVLIAMFFALLIAMIYYYVQNIVVLRKSPRLIVFWPCYILFPGIILRIVFLIDPLGIHLVFDERSIFGLFTTYVAQSLEISATLMTISVWLDAVIGMGKKLDNQSNFLIPKIISSVIAFALIAMIVLAFLIFSNAPETFAVIANGFMGFTGVCMTVFMCVYIPKVNREFKKTQIKTIVRKMSRSLILSALSFFFLVLGVILIIFLKGVSSTNDPTFVFYYFLIQLEIRIFEVLICVLVIYTTVYAHSKKFSSSRSTGRSGVSKGGKSGMGSQQ